MKRFLDLDADMNESHPPEKRVGTSLPMGWTESRTFQMRRIEETGFNVYAYRTQIGDYEIRPIPQDIAVRPFEVYVHTGSMRRTNLSTGETEDRVAPWDSWRQRDRSIKAGRYRIETTAAGTLCFCFVPLPGEVLPVTRDEALALAQEYIDEAYIR